MCIVINYIVIYIEFRISLHLCLNCLIVSGAASKACDIKVGNITPISLLNERKDQMKFATVRANDYYTDQQKLIAVSHGES